MREILFRGKRVDNGEWVFGVPHFTSAVSAVMVTSALPSPQHGEPYHFSATAFLVDPATVGQYTGLTANGKRLFEGDILKKHGYDKGYWLVSFCDGAFEVVGPLCCGSFRDDYSADNFEVIGNIHDNPELLEVEDE